MTRLGFLIARTLRQEGPLRAMSVDKAALLAELSGKQVALVGNARALSARSDGAAIDAADLVIRINRAPMPAALSHGMRTDWLALATAITDRDRARIRPARILWMSPKRKRLSWSVARTQGFFLHPLPDQQRLRAALGAPPTTGLMMIDLLLQSDLARLDLYGFDFFASLSLTGRRTAAQVPHDFASERGYVEAIATRDRRLHHSL